AMRARRRCYTERGAAQCAAVAANSAHHRQRSRYRMPEQYIVVTRDAPIATAIINRPDKLNALNWELIAELADRLEELDSDDAIRCVVLTGAGERAFAAGADIAEMADATPIQMAAGAFTAWDRIRRIKKPLVAAVGGYALGGGNELAMHCDIIIAS